MVSSHSLSYILIASVGPAVTALTEHPEMLFEGTASTVLGAVGLIIWRCATLATKWLEGATAHRELEIKQWELATQHMHAEREHWAATRSPAA